MSSKNENPVLQKTYQCNHCLVTCRRPQDLRRHLLVHMEASFQCDNCGNKFTRYDTLRRHKRDNCRKFKFVYFKTSRSAKDKLKQDFRSKEQSNALPGLTPPTPTLLEHKISTSGGNPCSLIGVCDMRSHEQKPIVSAESVSPPVLDTSSANSSVVHQDIHQHDSSQHNISKHSEPILVTNGRFSCSRLLSASVFLCEPDGNPPFAQKMHLELPKLSVESQNRNIRYLQPLEPTPIFKHDKCII